MCVSVHDMSCRDVVGGLLVAKQESQGVDVADVTKLLLVEKMLLLPPFVLSTHSAFV